MVIAVIGAGSWGTALAQVAAKAGASVRLWARREELARAINETRRNSEYLSDAELSPRITATSCLPQAIQGAQLVVVVTPSKVMRETAKALDGAALDPKAAVVLCTKGVEASSGLVPLQVFAEVIGGPDRLACLSGPNHAEEVIAGIPAGTVVASSSPETARCVQDALGLPEFRVYTSDDPVGVELCAAAKNVVAIAVGLSYGMGFGDNTAAMLMTRGQAEMSRLVEACGGSPLTCMGLAGTGDLIATCMSRHSRNRSFGEALAEGDSLEAYEARRHMVVEGAQACRALKMLSAKRSVELPLADAVDAIVWEGADPQAIGRALASRSLKPEFY